MKNEALTNRPEWIDVKGVQHSFGISKSTTYRLHAAGKIRAVSMKQPGTLRGKRLFSYDSVAAYIEKMANAQEATDSAEVMAVVTLEGKAQ